MCAASIRMAACDEGKEAGQAILAQELEWGLLTPVCWWNDESSTKLTATVTQFSVIFILN